MPAVKKAIKEPAALRQLTKSLDGAQAALTKLRADLGRDVSASSKALYKDLERFVKDARRHSGTFGKALQKDLTAARNTASSKTTAKPAARKTSSARKTTASSTRKTTTARKTTSARKPAARKTTGK